MKIPASKVPAQVWADKARRRADLDEVESMLLSSWDDSKQVYRIGKELWDELRIDEADKVPVDAGMREALAGDYDVESQSGEFWFDAEKEGPRGILNWLGFSVEDETEEGIDFVFFEDCGIAAYRDDMGRAVFEACAPVIGAGSVLVFMENWDEAEEKDPRIWRYTFDGEKMHVQDGRFVFD